MSLSAGVRLGPYEVVSLLGAGGMGEVYRVRDTALNRDVAVKVLPAAFAQDAERLARFAREAQTLAALNHPNIAAIYGIEGTALVMELVEGEDLSAIVARGPMPLADALPIARQIADALEAAHELGIVHRDLKPANIKVRADGTVKVLDFGLAKAMSPVGGPGVNMANSPTLTAHATAMGLIVGTAAYMSPEQARGRNVDRRADIWAFGTVLFEMLTGRQAFAGESITDVLAAIVKEPPDWTRLPTDTPAAVRRLLRRSLEKDPKRRLSAIGDARLELDDADDAPQPSVVFGAGSRRGAAAGAVAALTLAALAAAAAWYAKPTPVVPVRLLELPASLAAVGDVTLSPDGARVAYVLGGHLYVRALDGISAQDLGPVSGSSSAGFPSTLFWSPDSKTIGFSAEREIRTVPAGGGPVFAVTKIPATGEALAAKWFHDGSILFAVWRENVYSVPAAGGTPVLALALNPATEIDVHYIAEAPGNRLIARIHQRKQDRSAVVLADRGTSAGQPRVLLTEDQTINHVSYVAPGWVVFDRQRTNVGLWVAPFTGGPIDLTQAKLLQAGAGSAEIAEDGSLICVLSAPSKVTPVWIDRTGAVSPAAGGPFAASSFGFSLSPDGRRIAIVLGGDQARALGEDDTYLLVRDLTTGADTRLTFHAPGGRGPSTTGLIDDPSWFPSGDRILISSGEVEAGRLMVQKSDEASPASEFMKGLILGRIARDGRSLGAIKDDRGQLRLMSAPVSPDGSVGAAQRVFPDDDVVVDDFDLSPDGRWVVYSARQGPGQHTVFVSEFPTGHGQWQVADDADQPRFSPDGREIFYVKHGANAAGQTTPMLMSRTVSSTPVFALGAAIVLFEGESAALLDQQGYNVAPDGRKFLALKDVQPTAGEGKRLMWMQNWPAAAKK